MKIGKLEGFRWHVVMPMVMALYILAYIDRTNISFAMAKMQVHFGIDSGFMGFISGIFFIGYLILQVPVGHLSSNKGARLYVLVLSIAWGVFSSAQGFAQNTTELIIFRFLVGVAEGGVFPALWVIVTNWFPKTERGRASSCFFSFMAVSPLIMSPISGYIVQYVDC